jgi:hypothetical protein
VQRITFGSRRDELTGAWRRLHNEKLYAVLVTKYYAGNQIKTDETDRACSTFEGEERCIQGFSGET